MSKLLEMFQFQKVLKKLNFANGDVYIPTDTCVPGGPQGVEKKSTEVKLKDCMEFFKILKYNNEIARICNLIL